MAISKDVSTITAPVYRGRFAPSPTGPLHFGSLIAALASYLEARVHHGEWLVRVEDLDPPREMPGAANDILRTLEKFGFEWDGEVAYQSQRLELYRDALNALRAKGLAYPCACTRREVVNAGVMGIDGPVYSGTCRAGLAAGRHARAWRLRVERGEIEFFDNIQGTQRQNVARDVGDFVLLRADGNYAYQLAVVVDDAAQGVNNVVRGSDLLDSTARQIELQRQLGLPLLNYAHLPLALNNQGEKLSKQTCAPALDCANAPALMLDALRVLGQRLDAELLGAPLTEIWQWARSNWQLAHVPAQRTLP